MSCGHLKGLDKFVKMILDHLHYYFKYYMMFDWGEIDTPLENSFQGIQYNVHTCSHWLNNIKVARASKIVIYQSSLNFDKQTLCTSQNVISM
jgi:hypothetical protein